MGEYNGNSFEMGLLWGKLQGHMRHHGEAIERQNEILLDIKDTLTELPDQIASKIATPASVSLQDQQPQNGMFAALQEFMPSRYEIIFAVIATAVSIFWVAPERSNPGQKLETHTAE